jgi:RNA polymerase II-associated factor 1
VDESNWFQICFSVDLCRYNDPFVMVNFDGDPTADSEQFNKLERSVRDECESRVSFFSSAFSFLI